MTGRRADGTNPRAQGTNPRAIKAQLDRIESAQEQILRTLDRLTRQQRLGEHGPVTLDDGSVFLPGTGTIGQRTLSDQAQAALDALEQTDHHDQPERTTP